VSEYPEHAKLRDVKYQSQKIGEFIEWLGEQSMAVCHFDGSLNHSNYWPANEPINKLLARFFGIDLDKLEDEKTAMLDAQRVLNVKAAKGR